MWRQAEASIHPGSWGLTSLPGPRRQAPESPTLILRCGILILGFCFLLLVLVLQFSCSVVSDSVTPWTSARQASLSITNSWSLPKLMSIESVMSSNHLILCCPLLFLPQSFPASGSFPISQFFPWGGQSIGVSASTSVLPMNIQD